MLIKLYIEIGLIILLSYLLIFNRKKLSKR